MDVIRIADWRKSIGGDHRDEYRFLGACFPDEGCGCGFPLLL
ncbi:hypothetical protein [Segatella copri]|nr:hypothetical protein [Segatella copri]